MTCQASADSTAPRLNAARCHHRRHRTLRLLQSQRTASRQDCHHHHRAAPATGGAVWTTWRPTHSRVCELTTSSSEPPGHTAASHHRAVWGSPGSRRSLPRRGALVRVVATAAPGPAVGAPRCTTAAQSEHVTRRAHNQGAAMRRPSPTGTLFTEPVRGTTLPHAREVAVPRDSPASGDRERTPRVWRFSRCSTRAKSSEPTQFVAQAAC